MHIFPQAEHFDVDYDYVLIDPNLNANYIEEVEDKLVSLAPDYANDIAHVFPYLLRLNTVDKALFDEIQDHDIQQIKQGFSPFFLFYFKSFPTREPDIVKHLKQCLVYESDGKKYLYRFYDPRIWMILNYKFSSDFFWLNKYFQDVKFGFLGNLFYFKNMDRTDFQKNIDFQLLERIGIFNRTVDLLNEKNTDLNVYFLKVEEIFKNIEILESKKIYEKDDLITALFHIDLIGKNYIETSFFTNLGQHKKGYEQASKLLPTKDWEEFFLNNKVFDENLKNKVMYGY